jgi:hypothetical protein
MTLNPSSRARLPGSLLAVLLALALGVACGSGGTEIGTSCFANDACGTMQCLCVRGSADAGSGAIPGVCSTTCTSTADCTAKYGSSASCAKDFCTGVNLCLNGYSGPTVP